MCEDNSKNLHEAKLIGRRKSFVPFRQMKSDLDLSLLGKSHTARLSAKHWKNSTKVENIVYKLKNDLLTLLRNFQNAELGSAEFKKKAKRLLKDAHEESYLLGLKAGGFEGSEIPEVDKRWLNNSRKDEYKYFEKFLKDIEGNKGTLDYKERVQMYADAAHGSYESGRHAYIPNNMLIYWRLEKGKSPNTGKDVQHCETCLELSKMSPFSPANLPTVPRVNTNCLTNCLCQLIYVISTPKKVAERMNVLGTAESIINRLKKIGKMR